MHRISVTFRTRNMLRILHGKLCSYLCQFMRPNICMTVYVIYSCNYVVVNLRFSGHIASNILNSGRVETVYSMLVFIPSQRILGICLAFTSAIYAQHMPSYCLQASVPPPGPGWVVGRGGHRHMQVGRLADADLIPDIRSKGLNIVIFRTTEGKNRDLYLDQFWSVPNPISRDRIVSLSI